MILKVQPMKKVQGEDPGPFPQVALITVPVCPFFSPTHHPPPHTLFFQKRFILLLPCTAFLLNNVS